MSEITNHPDNQNPQNTQGNQDLQGSQATHGGGQADPGGQGQHDGGPEMSGSHGSQHGQHGQGMQAQPDGQQRQAINRTERRTRDNHLTLMPWVDVFENEDSILLLADLPGVSKDKLELRIENDSLQIEGEITTETPEQIEALYAEVRAPRYSRTFSLSSELDTANIDAQLRNGVLQLRIPKQPHAQPRRIEIKVA